MSTLDHLRGSIEARIAELKNEITLLESARAALQGGRTSRTTGAASGRTAGERRRRRTSGAAGAAPNADAGAKPGSGAAGEAPATTPNEAPTTPADTPAKPRRRSQAKASKPEKPGKPVEVLLAGRLETMLSEAADGLSAIAISRRANAGYDQVLDLLRHLESAGQVRRTGSRRTSLWRLITDEERIAERAAELERRSSANATTAP